MISNSPLPPLPPLPPTRLTILVIDDEESMRELLQMELANGGHTVLTAATGAEGLVIAANRQPDLILCDMYMPGMSGQQVVEALRRDYEIRHIPFVFLTACADPKSIRLGMAGGATEYLVKPFRPDELAEVIAACRRTRRWFDEIPARTGAAAQCA